MNQALYELFLSGVFVGFLFTLLLALLMLAVEQRRRHEILSMTGLLCSLGRNVVTRYTNAKAHSDRDEWVITDRAIQDLDRALQRWEKIAHDNATD